MFKKILYTGGTFDLFHFGHVNFLRQCKLLAETVVVSLNTDEFILEYKGESPCYNYDQRKSILESCEYVDLVIKNVGGYDSKQSIEVVSPNIIAVGSDWKEKNYHKQMGFTNEWLLKNGITLEYIPYTENISTTIIKRVLRK